MQTTTTHFAATHSAGGDDTLFLAGHTAPSGRYRLMGTELKVHLHQEDVLPATCDGRVAIYERCIPTWAERQLEQKGNGS